ncbi:hypothetical protein L798_07089 [Zootermopsis nevadensis]|uniref:Uncharacterized protein n=1 Tax=Zootermopsis nevadensis TaxID=136037 RepID=A0A067RRE5_ZOONE|nr:hypothetical protein L798_07089 [Zootermopsis nevadensis]
MIVSLYATDWDMERQQDLKQMTTRPHSPLTKEVKHVADPALGWSQE